MAKTTGHPFVQPGLLNRMDGFLIESSRRKFTQHTFGVQDPKQSMSAAKPQKPSEAAAFCCGMFLFGILGLVFITVLVVSVTGIRVDEPQELDPADVFQQLTSWQLPGDAVVLTNENTHSGLTNDGTYTLIVKLSPSRLDSLMKQSEYEWKPCPIPQQILDGMIDEPKTQGELFYAAKTMESDEDWHRGHVVIVDQRIGMVWIYEWKT